MDDDIPPLTNQIVQFLRAIASPQNPLPDDAAGDPVLLHNHPEESHNHTYTDHQHNHNPNQANRHLEPSDDENEDQELHRRHRRHTLRQRLHDLGLSAGRHDRIIDWADLLLQFEDQSVTYGLQRREFHNNYIGNVNDYVDVETTAYDSLLQTLANSDGSGRRRGAPPASKSVVEALQTVEVNVTSTELCAVCNDGAFDNEEKIVKRLPCGHLYHGDCITPWLNSKNTCPVCRHELPTDDPEYEQGRRQRSMDVSSSIQHGNGV